MIDGFNLTKELICFEKGFENWEDAIKASSKGLLEQGFIKESYVDSMIDSVKEYGPYIVIAPNIAMPHARPEAGSNKVGFSVMLCEEAVGFSKAPEHQARLFVTLSCVNADTHLMMLQALVGILGDDDKFQKILNSTTKEEILEIFE
ncbi:Ascorbate-specific phosphotransferase enzyme IIA component [Candidatus Izimaplasma bacterium HR1]|jgi:mannitol/fructose-specific phosphotransferase system IIA component (Ntr-type)|uniref:PTS sugar transporter subunit IIA n=1 Tax=Candidatus Izimoplasma sp. HR1 TaxID=1541959 RepID=UPI0004F87DA9|nr:Ascorbate-specific phosphotransferase enzyme IIA component [Candidatus Izimaplasma bacterium HR1]